MATTKIRCCPKCKSKDIHWLEMWRQASIGFKQDPETGVVYPYLHNMNIEGEPYYVKGHCNDCGRKWRPRGATSIDGITPMCVGELRQEFL